MPKFYQKGALQAVEYSDVELHEALATHPELHQDLDEDTYAVFRRRGPEDYILEVVRHGTGIATFRGQHGDDLVRSLNEWHTTEQGK